MPSIFIERSKSLFEFRKVTFLLLFLSLFLMLLLVPPMYVLIGIFGLTLGFLAFRYPNLVVYFLAVFIPLEEFIEKWLPTGLIYEGVRYSGEIFLLISIFSVLLSKLVLQKRWRSTPVDKPLVALLIAITISATINNVPLKFTVLGIRPFLRYIPILLIIAQVGIKEDIAERLIKWIYILGIIISSIAILQSIIGLPATYFLMPKDVVVSGEVVREGLRQLVGVHTRVFSTMGRYDTLGTYLCILILIGFGQYYYSSNPNKKILRIFIILALPAIILSYSRQSWLALFIGVMVILFLSNRKKMAIGILLIAVIGLLFLTIVFPAAVQYSSNLPDVTFINRILEPFSARYYEISRYSSGRLFVITEVSSRILTKAPIFGFGPARFGSLTTRYLGFDFSSLIDLNPESAFLVNDVNWVTLLGQIGLIGITFFIFLLFSMGFYAYKQFNKNGSEFRKGLALGYIGAIAAFIILGFFGPNFEVRQVSYFIWLFGGILIGLPKIT